MLFCIDRAFASQFLADKIAEYKEKDGNQPANSNLQLQSNFDCNLISIYIEWNVIFFVTLENASHIVNQTGGRVTQVPILPRPVEEKVDGQCGVQSNTAFSLTYLFLNTEELTIFVIVR